METSGPDIGRIKDIESAKLVGRSEHQARETGSDDDNTKDGVERSNEIVVGTAAAKHSLDAMDLAGEISYVAKKGGDIEDPMIKGKIAGAHQEAERAQASYKQFQKDKPTIQAQENANLRAELEAERAKSADSEADKTS